MTLSQEAIDKSLVELSHVGIAIRQSARTSETTRARRFVSTHHDLSSFEALSFLALETLYPNAQESLLLQLGKSMVDRYARLLFRGPRHLILKTDIRRQTSDSGEVSLLNSSSGDNLFAAQNSSLIPLHRASTMAPSSVDGNRFREKHRMGQTPRSRSGTTVILKKTCEPPVPRFNEGDEIQCQWCFANITEELVEAGRWSTLGR
jgi:hypothetical protein